MTSGIFCAATPKSSSGTAVTGPAVSSSAACQGPCEKAPAAPLAPSQTRNTTAIGAATRPSAVSDVVGSSGTIFFITP